MVVEGAAGWVERGRKAGEGIPTIAMGEIPPAVHVIDDVAVVIRIRIVIVVARNRDSRFGRDFRCTAGEARGCCDQRQKTGPPSAGTTPTAHGPPALLMHMA